VQAPDHLSAGVEGGLLARMLGPLLDNALRYADHQVVLRASREGSRIEVLVGDDGPGVPADDVPRIIAPGVRGTPEDGHDGAGLGLALADRLARTAGGRLVVTAAPDGGQFRLQLPAG
jgi:signal transduction histidine kinase